EPAGHRLPQRVYPAQAPVAVAHRLDLHPDRGKVVDLGEVLVLAGHLLPHGIDVLSPAGDLGLDPHLLELAGEDLAQVGDERLALVTLTRDALDDVVVSLGLEVAE